MNALANAAAAEALLLRQDADGIATLTLNRPAARNALSLALMEEFQAGLDAVATDDTVKLVVIAGAGPVSAPATTSRSCAPIPAAPSTSAPSPPPAY